MHTVDVLHLGAGVLLALLFLKGLQAIGEHYFPSSEGVAAARFILGGP